jgi:hypothetical protein|tara:strand:+ start:126 stop:500 length:375 start_codon:yes stop_codon:yes gene_type:complete
MDNYKVKAIKNYNTDFRYDLELGQLGEKHLGKILDNKKVEVKTDYQAMQTGNLFIEYYSRGKASGITTTEADWFAFILSNEKLIFISTKKLKDICRPYLWTKRDVKGGDDNTSQGILLPIKDLL